MIETLEKLLKEVRYKRENVDLIELSKQSVEIKEIVTVKETEKVIEKDSEYEEFLKDDILYLTKEIIKLNNKTDIKANKVFNRNEYDYKLEKLIEFNSNEWFSKNTNNVEIDRKIKLDIKQNSYISFNEKNIDFSLAPQIGLIEIQSGYEYNFSILGNKDENVIAMLFIISYCGNVKNNVYSVEFGKDINIRFSDDVTSIRLALRVCGTGIIDFKRITISSKKRLDFLGIDKYRQLGYDRPKTLKELKVAAICDEFTYQCLKPEVDLVTFTPENWKAIFTIKTPQILFIESAWRGVDNSWNRKISTTNDASRIYIKEVLNWCKKNNIPTVFWNKEDPVHFKAFIDTAKLCDYIFTTDENKVSEYKEISGNENVYSMQFFAQPNEHNPTKISNRREEEACFAGSYYAVKYVERQKDMLDLLDLTKEYGLTIYDRNFGTDNEQYRFPIELRKYVKGRLNPDEISKAYKGYKFMINVNSVIDSPTMFSRRVFEGLASGTPVISTYSEAIKNTFKDIVIMDEDFNELKRKFNNICNDDNTYYKKSLHGLREVYKKHTIQERLMNIAEIAGIPLEKVTNKICVICEINSEDQYHKFCSMYEPQVYENKYAIVITDLKLNSDKRIKKICNIDDLEGELEGYDYFTFFNINCYYGKNYLEDFNIATKYSNSNILGKSNIFSQRGKALTEIGKNKDYIYTSDIHKDTIFMNSKLIKKYDIGLIFKIIKENKVDELVKLGERSYSIDKYNFLECFDSEDNSVIDEIDI